MKKTWKWILGIFLVLVVVAALVAVPFAMRSYMFANNLTNVLPQARWNAGPMMGGNDGWQHPQTPGYQGDYYQHSGPMMGNGGRGSIRDFAFSSRFSPFGFGFMFLGGLLRLIPLALFALLVYAIYQLGRRSGLRSNLAAAPVLPAATEAQINEKPAE